jgi:2-polyprenyl-3-methyl-5-hydroxy-6-metoxy-1,4-benzoquinol methylase
MSHEQFIQELNKFYKITNPEQLEGLRLQHYVFASGSNSRGLKIIESIEKSVGFNFQGSRILDIGCAYGGFCIEAARKGAIAHGVDISQRLIRLAEINAADEKVDGEIRFYTVDATSNHLLASLPKNFFDLVFVNAVFEHVYDTPKLLENISAVAAPSALLYFVIPNGLCTRFIRKEGHRWVPGVSIMDPSYWHYRVKEHFNIYYRRWGYYAALLSYYGFNDIRLLNFGKAFAGDRAQLCKHLESEFEDIRKTISADLEREDSLVKSYKQVLSTKIMKIQQELQDDLKTMPNAELCWKYLTDFWKGIAVKRSDNSAAAEQRKLLRGGLLATEQAIKSSFSYQLGYMLVQAVRKPGRNTILLPYRLLQLVVTKFKNRTAKAAKLPAAKKLSPATTARQDAGPLQLVKPDAPGKTDICSPEDTKVKKREAEDFIVADPATLPTEEADGAKKFWSSFRLIRAPAPWSHFIAEEVMRFSPTSVFEFGCYNCRNLIVIRDQAPGVTYHGIDINPEAVAASQKAGFENVQLGDENMLHSFPDAAFDVCFTSSVLDHMPKPLQTMTELLRISRKACLFFEPFLGKEGKVLRNYNVRKQQVVDTTPFSYSWDYLHMLDAVNNYAFQGNLTVKVIDHPIDTNLGRYYRLYIVRRRAPDTADKPPLSISASQGIVPLKPAKPDAPGKPDIHFTKNIDKISYKEVTLKKVTLSPRTALIREKYIERYGADADKSLFGGYHENDWRRFEYISSLLPEGKSVLDIGIGNGAFLNLLLSLNRFQKILGIDIKRHSKFIMFFGRQFYQAMRASVTNLPLKDECLDVVTCMEVLEHLDKPSFIAALRELRRVSKLLIITVPYNQPEPLPAYHKLRFTENDLLTYFPDGEFILLRRNRLASWMAILERQ